MSATDNPTEGAGIVTTQDKSKNGWGWVNGVEGDDKRIEAIEERATERVITEPEFERAANTQIAVACVEARLVVLEAARLLGVNLGADPIDGELWSPANMHRVIEAIASLQYRSARAHGGGVDSLVHTAFAAAAYRGKTRNW